MARRPEPVEWPKDVSDLPHGTPLLSGGRLQAAMRDASWFDRPDVRKDKYAHVIVISSRMRMSVGEVGGWESAACDTTRIPLHVNSGLVWDAADVGDNLRCRRGGCVVLYATADQAKAATTPRD